MQSLCAEDRIGLTLDTYDLCKSGHLEDLGSIPTLLSALHDEQNPNVWDAMKLVLDGLEKPMQELDTLGQYRAFVASLIEVPFKALGWDALEEDDDLTKPLRGMMISLTATYNPSVMSEEAERRFDAFVADQSTPVLPDDYK